MIVVKELQKKTEVNPLEFPIKNKLVKRTLTLMVAGALTLSSTSVFAAEESEEETAIIAYEETIPLGEFTTQLNQLKQLGSDNQAETPSLLPGDFLYFAKIALEKIKLALTFDEEKEAELLATYAATRLSEAEALFNEGREEEALETIEKAREYLDTFGNKKENVDEEPVIVEDKNDEETNDEQAKDGESPNEAEQATAQNIIALQAALEKVNNPVAQASLLKNIEKFERKSTKSNKVEEENTSGKEEVAPKEDETKTEDVIDTAAPKGKKDKQAQFVAKKKEAQQQWKEEKEQIKAEAKQTREEIKAKRKEQVEQIKLENKQKQKEEKRQHKEEKQKRNN